jgi:hypothetical protein
LDKAVGKVDAAWQGNAIFIRMIAIFLIFFMILSAPIMIVSETDMRTKDYFLYPTDC